MRSACGDLQFNVRLRAGALIVVDLDVPQYSQSGQARNKVAATCSTMAVSRDRDAVIGH